MNMTTIRSRWNTWPFVPCRDLLFLDKVKNVVIEIRGFSLSFNSISLSFFGVNRYSGNNRCDRICIEKFEFFLCSNRTRPIIVNTTTQRIVSK